MSKNDSLKEIVEHIIGNESTVEKTQEPERIVFGLGIGPNYCKTPAEAFFWRLESFESNLRHATNESERLEILNKQKLFLDTFRDDLLPGENSKEIIKSALEYGQSKIASKQEEIINHEVRMNEDKGFIDVLGEPYVDNHGRDILNDYQGAVSTISLLAGPNFDMIDEGLGMGEE